MLIGGMRCDQWIRNTKRSRKRKIKSRKQKKNKYLKLNTTGSSAMADRLRDTRVTSTRKTVKRCF